MSLATHETTTMTLTVRQASAIAFGSLLALREDEHHGVPKMLMHALPTKRDWQERDLDDRITVEVTPDQRAFIDLMLRGKAAAQ